MGISQQMEASRRCELMKRQVETLFLRVLFSCWIFIVGLIHLIILGSNEFIPLLEYYFPNFIKLIKSWLVPLLSAPYLG